MNEPYFGLEGVDENQAFVIKDGETVIETLRQATVTGNFDDFDFTAYDGDNEYFFECLAYAVLDRYGKERLYLAVKNAEEEENVWRPAYIARRKDGSYLLVKETDEGMFNELNETLTETETAKKTEKKGKGWRIAFKIILFPFWLIWQFIKAILSLFNIGFGDSSTVKAFKKGYSGDSDDYKEYTFTNDMGSKQTVYSNNGRDFYNSDGSYAGSSDDGGKTIRK